MMENSKFLIYLLVMAGVTYLVRAIPMALIKEKTKNRFVQSFLHYIPYTVLSAMTVPAIFYATDSPVTAAVGFVVAIVAALFERSLVQVAALSCLGVLVTEIVIKYVFKIRNAECGMSGAAHGNYIVKGYSEIFVLNNLFYVSNTQNHLHIKT